MKKLIMAVLMSISINSFAQSNLDKIFIQKVNAFRAQNGLTTLTYHQTLDSAAEWHSQYMNTTGVVGHTEIVYHNPQDRILKYDPTAFKSTFDKYIVLENAAKFTEYAKSLTDEAIATKAFTMWLNSDSHKAAMLTPNIKYVGFGVSINQAKSEPFPNTFFTGWCTMVVATTPYTRVISD